MEGPVKERLTGALILVAALVIIVPEMLLRPARKPAASAVSLAQTSEAGAPLRTYSMELKDSTGTVEATQAALAPQSAAASVVETPEPATPAPSPPVEAQAVTAPAKQTVAPPAESSATRQKPELVAKPATGAWWTQLGSFSSRDNAARLAQKLRAAGFSIEVSKVGAAGKELYRVRAGPVQGRAEAVALQTRLSASGHKSTIVAP